MKKIHLLHVLLILPILILGSTTDYKRTIQWKGVQTVTLSDQTTVSMLRFEGSLNEYQKDFIPLYHETFNLTHSTTSIDVQIRYAIFEPASTEESAFIEKYGFITNEIAIEGILGYDQKNPVAAVSFIPIRKNEITGQYEKLIRFTLIILEQQSPKPYAAYKTTGYKSESVLASGNWYKVGVEHTGVHKITYQNLSDMGIPVSSINPKHIRIYGFRGGMLAENIEKFRYDDLQEAAIYVEGENDGSFNTSDYVLFYGESPDVWKYSSEYKLLTKRLHLYADYTYYYITTEVGEGKRIPLKPSSPETPNHFVNSFHDAIHYETEEVNLLNSGRIWYGETFDLFNNMVKEFTISNLVKDSKITLQAQAAARSQSTSFFSFYINEEKELHLSIPGVNISNINGDYAAVRSDTSRFYSGTNDLSVKVVYTKSTNTSVGYLDYFTLNYKQELAFNGGQLPFRNLSTANAEFVTEYTLSKANATVTIWEVTNPLNVNRIESTLSGTKMKFVMNSDSIQEFIAFDGSSFNAVSFIEKTDNQNLHGVGEYEMVILTHPNFRSEAERLAQFHRDFDNMTVFVTDPSKIYNEFSSGAQDITAIRDFMKMMYDKASPGKETSYLLLFGDGSFDYKDRIENNTNYIPCWESYESLNPVSSYVKDDFYCLLDDGNDSFVDIGVGRFVVSTPEQAKTMVDKTIYYASNSDAVMGDWRNMVCLIADDEDSNLHFGDAEDLASIIDTMDHTLNIEKIYLDAYPQVSTPSGERYPDVTLDINNRVERGALIMNYVGHGGEGGLAHERIMTINDINSWNNLENMPVFITATCEFSRFDDPERTSAGEYISLNPNGGGIALFTTTRATYAGANFDLNRNFYRYALKRENGEHLRMGEVMRLAKNASGSVENKSKFMLLGDPAIKIAFPEEHVVTTKINNISIEDPIDTIQALSKVTIRGEIQDYYGNKLTDVNGILYPTVFDKPTKFSTLGNDPASNPAEFHIQKNALYKGKTTIDNGIWEFTFIAPKDIAYQFGFGKLSFYAKNDKLDATGFFADITIGGYNNNAETDNEGPTLDLYMNDVNFLRGGLTDESPNLFAQIFDENGINTVGNGIGHDILATLDGKETFVLNNYYEAELNNYQGGSILYPFYNLPNGKHTLSLKVWDVYNNSTTANTDFIVAESVDMAVDELINYPNPFRESTTFSFEHNQVEQPLDITIYIYALDGRLVATLNDIYYAGGFRYKSLVWNRTDNSGNKLNEGMYVYKLLVKNYDGTVISENNKLVILK